MVVVLYVIIKTISDTMDSAPNQFENSFESEPINGSRDEKKEGHKRSLRDVLKRLADETTLHGVPKIVSASLVAVKVLWSMLFLATLGLMTYQVYHLILAFRASPVDTKVSLKFSPLRFPAITFCNMNPVKKSKMTKQLLDAISDKPTASPSRKKRGIVESPIGYDENPDKHRYSENLESLGTGLLRRYKRSHYEPVSSNSSNSSDSSYSSAYNASIQEAKDEFLTGERDDWETKRKRFQYVFKGMSKSNRSNIGHKAEDLVMKATFLGINRNVSSFKLHETAEYGNCYTIDDPMYRSWTSGPANGIWLTLNLEKEAYVDNLNSAFGVRLVLHESGTLPLPAQEGIVLSPGTDTYIALKMVHMSRLSEPYGECAEEDKLYNDFGIKYTSATCMQICRTQLILDMCDCLPFDAPELDFGRNASVCNMVTSADEDCVLLYVDGFMASGDFQCYCPVSCEEVFYEKTMSWRQWPSKAYMEKVLFKNMCQQLNTSSYEEIRECEDSGASGANASCNSSVNLDMCEDEYKIDPNEWSRNFLRVGIYYETLDYEYIEEQPSYEMYRFASDIGGTIGLCIGASLLSIVEIFQLGMEVFLWWYHNRASNNAINPTDKQTKKQ